MDDVAAGPTFPAQRGSLSHGSPGCDLASVPRSCSDGDEGKTEQEGQRRPERVVRVEPVDGGLTEGQAEAARDHRPEQEAG